MEAFRFSVGGFQGCFRLWQIEKVTAGFGIVEQQPVSLGTEIEVEERAVTPSHPVGLGSYRDRPALSFHQDVASKRVTIVLAAHWVEPPVFADADTSVKKRLRFCVHPVGTGRAHFQHEVRGLAHFLDDKTVAPVNGRRLHAEGNVQVGPDPAVKISGVIEDEATSVYEDIES